MYGLPLDFDPAVFVGRELAQVSFSANTVHLSFDGDVSVTIVGAYLEQATGGGTAVRRSIPVESSSLMALVGQTVSSTESGSDGDLTLRFARGGAIVCLDESKQYEAYSIHLPGREIIV